MDPVRVGNPPKGRAAALAMAADVRNKHVQGKHIEN